MNAPTLARDAWSHENARLAVINAALGADRLAASPLLRCVAPLLVALHWFGAPRNLLPHLTDRPDPFTATQLQALLNAEGYRVQPQPWSVWQRQHGGLDTLPVGSILIADQAPRVFLGRIDGQDWWHDGQQALPAGQPREDATLLHIQRIAEHTPIDAPQRGWLRTLFYTARHEIGGILFVSLIANLLALAISLFTMFVYNTVIPSGSINILWGMTLGAVIAIFGAWGLRIARAGLMARLTAWAGAQISQVAMAKTLGLPVDVSARAGVENNLIRLRSLEGVRQWFGGGGGAVNADYPFVFIFILVIAFLGGWIALVPMVGLLLFFVAGWPLSRFVEERANRSSRASRQLGELTTVTILRLRALRGVRGTALWNRHLAERVAQSVASNRDHALAMALTQTIGQALGMLTVLATMGAGIALVLAGDMSTGGLIAAMMLIWRITTPAQQLFASQVRIKQLGDSSRQLDRLLESVGEVSNPQMTSTVASLEPTVEADRLFYRHSAEREPALGGVSFKLEAGQMLAVVGPNGSGKTTLLETLAALHAPQNGRVLVGGRDIRQFDPVDYRAWIGYLPQRIAGLPTTVRDSLQLRRPASADFELTMALTRVAGPEWWRLFDAASPEAALDARITPWREDLPALRARFVVRLAAAILGDPPLVILDDPLGDRDPALDPYLLRLLDSLRGSSTVILATHRPDLIQRAGFIAVLNDGALAHFGPIAPPESAAPPPVITQA
jgi:ABC-type bacteriocin/lantibiotic exporter with double-glycine peptidase domain